MDKEIEQRKRESEDDKAKIEKRRREQRKFLDEIPEEFKLSNCWAWKRQRKPAWVITADPSRAINQGPGSQADRRNARRCDRSGEYQWSRLKRKPSGPFLRLGCSRSIPARR